MTRPSLFGSRESAPVASERLLARIQQSRANGERVILAADAGDDDGSPESMDAPQRSSSFKRYAIAAGVLLAASVALQERTTPERVGTADLAVDVAGEMTNDLASGLADALSPLPKFAYAQSTPGGAIAMTSSRPIDASVNATSLKPAVWTYASALITDGSESAPNRVVTVSLDRDSARGRAAWHLVSTVTAKHIFTDELWLDPATLRPIERRQHMARYEFRQQFDSSRVTQIRVIHDSLSSKVDTTYFSINPTGLLIVNESQLQLLFRLSAQRGSLNSSWIATYGGPRASPVSLLALEPHAQTVRVQRSDAIRTPWARIPVWRVAVDGAPAYRFYISKATGDIVRKEFSGARPRTTWRTDLLIAP
jgi:hypothetical protein